MIAGIVYISKALPNLRATMPINASDGVAVVLPYYEPDQRVQGPAVQLIVN